MAKKRWPLSKSLFKNNEQLALEQAKNELKVTRAWISWLAPLIAYSIGFLWLGWPIIFGLLFYSSTHDIINNPFYWIGLIGLALMVGYAVLAASLNQTIVSISPEKIEITSGPVPWFNPSTQQLKIGVIDRVKAVRALFGYELQATYGERRRSVVLFRILEPSLAFYLEEEIND